MIRRIVHIDEEKCNGCGLCAQACHESAIGMVNGKAKLLRDDYCDGLGDCLPACPAGAISFIEREAAAYDEAAVLENKKKKAAAAHQAPAGGCPGTRMRQMNRRSEETAQEGENTSSAAPVTSQLSNWPVQIKLAPIQAPYFEDADLLIAADCSAYAYGNFHGDFIDGKITLMGCPKLDMVDYSEKLTELFTRNTIRSITLTRMEVPCCGGLEYAVKQAVAASGKDIPLKVVTIGINGDLK